MTTTLSLLIISLLLSLGFTPLVRLCALRCGLVDLPDSKRKVHLKPVARAGGVAVFASFVLATAAVSVAAFLTGHTHDGEFQLILALLPAAIMVFLIGLADDLYNLKPSHKFLVQIAAAALVIGGGLRIGLALAGVGGTILGIGLTFLWLVGCSNAVNLIDGLDGLAAGITVLASVTMMISAGIAGDWTLMIAIAPFCGAVAGFLFYNWRPASIFLGDSGSLTAGFLLACYGVLWTRDLPAGLATLAPAMTLSVPLLDTSLAMLRRFLAGRPLFRPDRSHIHHRLLGAGLSHVQSVLTMHAGAAFACALALSAAFLARPYRVVAVVVFLTAVLLAVRQLGYSEFAAAFRIARRGDFRRDVQAELALDTLELGLDSARTVDDCWTVLEKALGETGYQLASMRLRGLRVEDTGSAASRRSSVIGIAISNDEWIEVLVEPHDGIQPAALVPLIWTVRRCLTGKSLALQPAPFTPEHLVET